MHESPGNWLPARAALHPTGLFLSLRDIAPDELQDAFMQETVVRVPARETVVQIDRGSLGRDASPADPAGIVFHVARCGSTLVSQLLKARGGAAVYSEPLPVNEILVPPARWVHGELALALRSVGALFARHAQGPYVLKLTSWNTLFCDVVAAAFPRVPWVLVVRDPLEVCVSLLERPAGWIWDGAAPAPAFARYVDPSGVARTREAYVAAVYAALCSAAARLDRAHGRIVDYASLPAAAWETVAPHFSLPADDAARLRMQGAARRDAKAPRGRAVPFEPDGEAKRGAATPALREAVDAFARPALAELLKSTA